MARTAGQLQPLVGPESARCSLVVS
jgi:hypothetical protein